MSLRDDLEAFYNATLQQSPSVQKTLKGELPEPGAAIMALSDTARILREMIYRLADAIDDLQGVQEGEDRPR
jgi:hypothetical protein